MCVCCVCVCVCVFVCVCVHKGMNILHAVTAYSQLTTLIVISMHSREQLYRDRYVAKMPVPYQTSAGQGP